MSLKLFVYIFYSIESFPSDEMFLGIRWSLLNNFNNFELWLQPGSILSCRQSFSFPFDCTNFA